jgi:hypothetical protein
MNYFVLSVILLIAKESLTLSCPVFQCFDFPKEKECSLKTMNGSQLLVQLRKCTDNLICPFTGDLDEDEFCIKPSNLYPGDYCEDPAFCQSQNCQNNVCKGSIKDANCSADIDCDIGLFCLNNKCSETIKLNNPCNASAKCAVDSICMNGTCIQIASLELAAQTYAPAACKSFYMENGVCKAGPRLDGLTKGDTATPCPEDSKCKYTANDGNSYTEGCTCGMQEENKAVCRIGEGDVDLSDVRWSKLIYIVFKLFKFGNSFKTMPYIKRAFMLK